MQSMHTYNPGQAENLFYMLDSYTLPSIKGILQNDITSVLLKANVEDLHELSTAFT